MSAGKTLASKRGDVYRLAFALESLVKQQEFRIEELEKQFTKLLHHYSDEHSCTSRYGGNAGCSGCELAHESAKILARKKL